MTVTWIELAAVMLAAGGIGFVLGHWRGAALGIRLTVMEYEARERSAR